MAVINVKGHAEPYDVYIAYASEDAESVTGLVAALRASGLRVWFDQTALIVGESLRAQMDRGLNQSTFGILVLSNHFFSKKWPQQELDGMLALEISGEPRVLPVWLNVSYAEVSVFSPMLAGRKAAVSTSSLADVVPELTKSIGELLVRRGHFPTLVRLQTSTLQWRELEFFDGSLSRLDDEWLKLIPPSDPGSPIDLPEMGVQGARLDSQRIALCGHQRDLQHFAMAGDIDEWVFQMYSTQADVRTMAYVRVLQRASDAVPRQPIHHLTITSGYVIARGNMATFDSDGRGGTFRQCFYLMSDRVLFTPEANNG